MTMRVLEGILAIGWIAILSAPIVARRNDPDGFVSLRRYRKARVALARRFDGTVAVELPIPSSPRGSSQQLVRRRRVYLLLGAALLAGLIALPVDPLGGFLTSLVAATMFVGYVRLIRRQRTPSSSIRQMVIQPEPSR
ncbi:hypothetical protein Afer_1855 [Acidimicrobium ferrooxidans DSM 10331]|uniref:Transmembrane protein n=1 Tax=Acidimicrobium ferrooxidans (strain DSM 10331 / JCM 15462 / NBRC 103882 / ICP) TaxID=525909 RepID=C7M1C1_ACIFD|nr:hypothetical protein [Acidimicrobium ferrooxidans]ACU54769.1 hypothetical protein Afer_1855 [Acidimicrobium ferrooxidans DSM 10331]